MLDKLDGQVAGLIMEPAMMNINIIPPVEGYLERVRELCTQHGVKLIFDEVKTGATIGYGGATQRFGVQPDLITLAKAVCGGYPGGAIGMTAEIAELVSSRPRSPVRDVQRQPAGDGGLRGDPDRGTGRRRLRQARGDQREAQGRLRRDRSSATACPPTPRAWAPRAASSSRPERIHEYRDYLSKVDGELATLGWLYHMNHGIFMTPGVEEEWTLSVAHSDDDVERYLNAFETFARDVTGG